MLPGIVIEDRDVSQGGRRTAAAWMWHRPKISVRYSSSSGSTARRPRSRAASFQAPCIGHHAGQVAHRLKGGGADLGDHSNSSASRWARSRKRRSARLTVEGFARVWCELRCSAEQCEHGAGNGLDEGEFFHGVTSSGCMVVRVVSGFAGWLLPSVPMKLYALASLPEDWSPHRQTLDKDPYNLPRTGGGVAG